MISRRRFLTGAGSSFVAVLTGASNHHKPVHVTKPKPTTTTTTTTTTTPPSGGLGLGPLGQMPLGGS